MVTVLSVDCIVPAIDHPENYDNTWPAGCESTTCLQQDFEKEREVHNIQSMAGTITGIAHQKWLLWNTLKHTWMLDFDTAQGDTLTLTLPILVLSS